MSTPVTNGQQLQQLSYRLADNPQPLTLEYLSAGSAKQPTVICLHGIGGDCHSFAPQFNALSTEYRLIAWNMPGYGRSSLLPTTRFDQLAAALLALLDQLQIRSATLVGHSIGGMIAQEFALRYPERVHALSLLATTSAFGSRDDSFKQRFLAARLEPLDAGKSMAELAAQFVPQLLGSNPSPEVYESALRSMQAIPETSYRAVLACLTTFDRYCDSRLLGMPVCLLAGEQDQIAPAATMRKMADKIPDAQFNLLAGVGHLVNLEAAAACNEILLRFFSTSP